MKTKSQIATVATLILLGSGLTFVFQNCGAPFDATTAAGDAAVKTKADDVTELKTTIKSLSTQDLSCATDDDCQPVALGAKACGGPTEYVLVSRHNADLNHIIQLAEQHRNEAATLNRESGAVSDCSLVMPPETHCVSSVCE